MKTQSKKIPEGWKEVRLGDVADVVAGFAFNSKHFIDKGTVKVIKIKDIKPPFIDIDNAVGVDTSFYEQGRMKQFLIENGDFVVAMTGLGDTLGKVGRLRGYKSAYINQRVAKICNKVGHNKDFIYYNVAYHKFQTFIRSNIESNTVQENIGAQGIGRYTFLLPSFPEQKAIVRVLGALDDKIELLLEQNKTLEQIGQMIFHKWFVEDVDPNWKEGRVSDLVQILSGFAFKGSSYVENGEYRLITIKNVQDGYLDLTKTNFLKDVLKNVPEHCLLKIGDITLSLTGNVGRCCLITDSNLLLNQRVAKLKPRENKSFAFTYLFFRQFLIKRKLEDMASGSTAQPNLSPVETGKIKIIIPSPDVLQDFSEIVNPLLYKFLKNSSQIRILEKMRDTLLPKLVSGEVRVKGFGG